MNDEEYRDIKAFNDWNEEKKKLHLSASREPRFHEREIWWCSIGKNLGGEQDGKNTYFERPVLIVKKFNDDIAWILPISSKIKSGKYYHIMEINKKTRSILLSQLRLISASRFRRIMSKISPHQFSIIREKIRKLI